MEVRGAPLIGGTAAYGIVLAIKENKDSKFIQKSSRRINPIKTNCDKFKMGSGPDVK